MNGPACQSVSESSGQIKPLDKVWLHHLDTVAALFLTIWAIVRCNLDEIRRRNAILPLYGVKNGGQDHQPNT